MSTGNDEAVCNVCAYWQYKEEDEIEERMLSMIGECRKLPPTMMVIDGREYAGWPSIKFDDWCGEWRRSAESELELEAKFRAEQDKANESAKIRAAEKGAKSAGNCGKHRIRQGGYGTGTYCDFKPGHLGGHSYETVTA